MYAPLNYEQLCIAENCYIPSMVKNRNNKTYKFWERALFQRVTSIFKFEDLPSEWTNANTEDFFKYCLFRYGVLAVSENSKFGLYFQPCTLSGYNFYYQPTTAIINNPMLSTELTISKNCELIKLCPDFFGCYDIVSYYAEKLSLLDNAINMSLVNNKLAYIIASKNKASGEALKKILDKINSGEPTVIYDQKLVNDPQDKSEPWQFLERRNLKENYLTTDQLADFETIIKNFDTEIGIPTVSEKKERLVTSEAESKVVDSTCRMEVWLETLTNSIDNVNKHYGTNIKVSKRFNTSEGGVENAEVNIDRNV